MKKVAQTRSAATYGLLQMGYPTAVARKYPMDLTSGSTGNLPENINITQTNLELAIPYLELKLESELEHEGDSETPESYWTLGYKKLGLFRLTCTTE